MEITILRIFASITLRYRTRLLLYVLSYNSSVFFPFTLKPSIINQSFPPYYSIHLFCIAIFLLSMSHSSQAKFSFKNLQPINYLKTFNKMIDYQSRNSDPDPKKPQLKIVSFSKFPTPKDYENMEGIFQSVSKKKMENDMNKYNKELEEEEKFMKKHNDFMRKVLAKFIQHNESRQKTYEKQKLFYKQDFKARVHLRSLSEAKLQKPAKDLKEKDKQTIDQSKTDGKATFGSEATPEEGREEKSVEILPKLQPRKKRERMTLKKQKDIQAYVVNRKLTNPQLVSARAPMTAYHQQDQGIDFKSEIVNLQKKQAKIQANFTERIEKEVSEFGRKMSIQVHAINYYNFWKEPSKLDESQDQREKKLKQQKENTRETQDRADFSIKIGNYQSV